VTILDTPAAAIAQLRSQLADCLGSDKAWAPALSRIDRRDSGLHLAVLIEPFHSWLLDGTKTIESRFSRVRCAPYGVLAEGDVIVVKKSGGPVSGAFQASQVRSYQLTPDRIRELRGKFAAQICAEDDDFWTQRADCTYATLIDVAHVRALPGLPFPKKDRRGWVPLLSPSQREALL
jgi:hypothetical protein